MIITFSHWKNRVGLLLESAMVLDAHGGRLDGEFLSACFSIDAVVRTRVPLATDSNTQRGFGVYPLMCWHFGAPDRHERAGMPIYLEESDVNHVRVPHD